MGAKKDWARSAPLFFRGVLQLNDVGVRLVGFSGDLVDLAHDDAAFFDHDVRVGNRTGNAAGRTQRKLGFDGERIFDVAPDVGVIDTDVAGNLAGFADEEFFRLELAFKRTVDGCAVGNSEFAFEHDIGADQNRAFQRLLVDFLGHFRSLHHCCTNI